MQKVLISILLIIAVARLGHAHIFGSVRVTARDPQNLAVPDAEVTVKAKASQWSQMSKTNREGEALFQAVPIGQYIVTITAPGFVSTGERVIEVTSNTVTPIQSQLQVQGVEQSVRVVEELPSVNPESSTTWSTAL